MSGFSAFLKKELRETRKTWRLWVLPGVLVFLGLTVPIMTAATPAILKATARSQPGVVIEFPPPTSRDAYNDFLSNLAQLALLAVIIAGAAMIASERRAGTVVFVLTKPLTRAGFVCAKAVSNVVLLLAATAIGAVLCVAGTAALFDTRHIGAFLAAVVVWLVLAVMVTFLMLLLSAWFNGQAQAAGVGIGVYVGLLVLTGFPLLREHSPAGLMAANDAFLRGRDAALAWPLVTTIALAALCLAGAIWVFRRKEL
jgi:ABC-2 type transport system permease protein